MSPVKITSEKQGSKAWDDTRLVKKCLGGDQEAWSSLVDKYKALIYSIPVKYGLPPQEAADVFQSTCLELLARLPELREPRALPKWLMQVAHHECYRLKRQSQRVVSRDGNARAGNACHSGAPGGADAGRTNAARGHECPHAAVPPASRDALL